MNQIEQIQVEILKGQLEHQRTMSREQLVARRNAQAAEEKIVALSVQAAELGLVAARAECEASEIKRAAMAQHLKNVLAEAPDKTEVH